MAACVVRGACKGAFPFGRTQKSMFASGCRLRPLHTTIGWASRAWGYKTNLQYGVGNAPNCRVVSRFKVYDDAATRSIIHYSRQAVLPFLSLPPLHDCFPQQRLCPSKHKHEVYGSNIFIFFI